MLLCVCTPLECICYRALCVRVSLMSIVICSTCFVYVDLVRFLCIWNKVFVGNCDLLLVKAYIMTFPLLR